MRVRLSWNKWLVIIAVALSAAGLLGWWYVHEGRDHDQHAGHDHAEHTETKKPEAPAAGRVKPTPEAVQQAKPDHDHDQHADTKEPEAAAPGQVKLTPEAVKLAKIETAPVVLGPMDNRMSFTGELVFNEERLAKIHSRAPGRVVKIVADYGQTVKSGEVLAVLGRDGQSGLSVFSAGQKLYQIPLPPDKPIRTPLSLSPDSPYRVEEESY